MSTKGELKKFIDKMFGGISGEAANEMVSDFCQKHGMPGSTGGYDLYQAVQKAFRQELSAEAKKISFWKKYDKSNRWAIHQGNKR